MNNIKQMNTGMVYLDSYKNEECGNGVCKHGNGV